MGLTLDEVVKEGLSEWHTGKMLPSEEESGPKVLQTRKMENDSWVINDRSVCHFNWLNFMVGKIYLNKAVASICHSVRIIQKNKNWSILFYFAFNLYSPFFLQCVCMYLYIKIELYT